MPAATVSAEREPSDERVTPRIVTVPRKRKILLPPGFAYFGIAILLLAALSGLAHGAPSPLGPNGLQVANLVASPQTHGVVLPGQPVHFYGNVTGGLLYNYTVCSKSSSSSPCVNGVPGNLLTQPGWHLYWFFGQVNGTQNVSNVSAVQQHLPQPSACAPPASPFTMSQTSPCPVRQPFQQTFSYAHVGTYVVSLTVYDGNFDYVIATTEVTVAPPSFSMKINSIQSTQTLNGTSGPLEGVPLVFNGSCLGNCSNVLLEWNFGDGSVGYGNLANHAYEERGTYAVTLTGVDATSGAENRTFSTTYVSNLGPFGSVSSPARSLTGPVPVAYYPFHLPGIRPVNPPGANPFHNITVGVPIDFCTVAYDINPIDGPNLTFVWRFGDGGVAYTYPITSLPVGNATSACEANRFGHAAPEFTIASHAYTCPGFYNVTVTVVDEERLNSTSPTPLSFHARLLAAPTGAIPHYSVPVGQVAFLNATNTLGLPPTTAFYNFTWTAGKLGPTYGDVGRISSFRVANQSVSLAATANTTVLTCCSKTPVTASTYSKFFDVKPTVGIDSFYTEATITLTVENPSAYNNLNFTLLENGVNEGWYNLSYPSSSVTFQPVDFQMANHWAIRLNYTPYGQSGGTYVDVVFAWTDDNTAIDGFDSTESPEASDTVSVFFSNSNTSKQNSNTFSVNQQAVGEPVFGEVVFFSPAQTNLTETWKFGYGSPQTTHDSAPSQPGPTMSTWQFEAAYNYGATYTFNVSACDDYNYCSGDQITVTNTNTLIVSDTAPFITLHNASGYSPKTVPGFASTFKATVYNQDNVTGNATVTWQYGDGLTSTNSTGNADGSILYGVHAYRYSFNEYVLVAYATSKNGSTSANYTLVYVANPPPLANFTFSPAAPFVGDPVSFFGAGSQASVLGAQGLSFGWVFGDGHIAGGQGVAGMLTSNVYAAAKTYTATLVVESDEGVTASASKTFSVAVAPINPPFPTVSNATVTSDQFSWLHVVIPPGSSFSTVPLVNATWNWNDPGSPEANWGLTTGHTFLLPGFYNISVALTGPNMGTYTAHATITVYDGSPSLSLAYAGAEVYGGPVPMNLTALVLGDYADQGKAWNFTWTWGDGTPSTLASPGGNLSAEVHTYNYSGPISLTVSAAGPYPGRGAPAASTTDTLFGVPDSDADGLPDAYEVMVTHTNPYLASTSNRTRLSGTGCTDYVGPNCMSIPGIGSFNGDNDGDGLTNIQEILGTVTGFYSNPLDSNTAGDGIPDGAHFFSDSFSAAQTVPFFPGNTSSNPAVVGIPNVAYYGPSIAFNESTITVQVSTGGSLTALDYLLVDPAGQVFNLSSPGGAAASFTLITSTPGGGPVSHYGLSVSDFTAPGTWNLEVTDQYGGASGSVIAATIAISYHTDPGHADPLHQGMLQGHSLAAPIFNCSENPSNATFPVFDPTTFHLYNVTHFYPYTETYAKLSLYQGVPYVWGNGSYTAINNPGSCLASGLPQALWNASATYLGDADFGISPWNAHAAGDPSLTNGMKALGTHDYDMTEAQYLSFSSCYMSCTGTPYTFTGDLASPYNHNVTISYPRDTLTTYTGPLNPTALSTAGDGMPDSKAADPVAPLGLQVTISSATDPNCYVLASLIGGPQDIASVTLETASGQNEPTIYTPAALPSNNPSANCDTIDLCSLATGGLTHCPLNFGTQNYAFTYNSQHFFPLDNTQSTFTVVYNLWQNQTLTPTPARVTTTVTGNLKAYTWWNTSVGSGIVASAEVVPLQRLPVVLVNMTGELESLPGYGYRYTGEQRFYSFDVNLGSGPGIPAGFSAGTNVVLESRTALLNSSANLTMLNHPTDLANLTGCSPLGSAQVTSPASGSAGVQAIQLTVSGDLSSSPSCMTALLTQLSPKNGSGVIHGGEYVFLSTVQLELLGLDAGALLLAPFQAPTNFNSPSGTPPSNLLSEVATAVENAVNAIAGSILALANFLASFPSLLAGFGQALLGAVNAAVAAIKAVAGAIVSAFEYIVRLILAVVNTLITDVIHAALTAIQTALAAIGGPLLSIFWDRGNITSQAQFNNLTAAVGLDFVPLAFAAAEALLAEEEDEFEAISAGLTALMAGTEDGLGASTAEADKPVLVATESSWQSLALQAIVNIVHLGLTTVSTDVAVLLITDPSVGVGDLHLGSQYADGAFASFSSVFYGFDLYSKGIPEPKIVREFATALLAIVLLLFDQYVLNKDARDWTADLEFGLLTGVMLLSALGIYYTVTELPEEGAFELSLTVIGTIFSHVTPFFTLFLSAFRAAQVAPHLTK